MRNKLVIGTRGSALALKQTDLVIKALKKQLKNMEFDIKIISTTGDKILNKTLDKIGGKGLFVFEIEKALMENEIDIAVHSMKDVPAFVDKNFKISPLLSREDPRDVLISKNNIKLSELPQGSIIGTSSLRRIAQIKRIRRDLNYLPIRGNVDTRIKKMENGEFDGIILAAAGLNRMGMGNIVTEYFETDSVIPAVGQGTLCVEYIKTDNFIKEIVEKQNRHNEIRGILAERSFLEAVNGSCSVAMGAFGEITQDKLRLKGFYSENSDKEIIIKEVNGSAEDYVLLGKALAAKLKK